MKNVLKIRIFIALSVFILTFTAYLLTLGNDFAGDTDYILTSIIVENFSMHDPKGICHLSWVPLGRLAYWFANHLLGLNLRGVTILEIISAFSGAITSSLFFWLLTFITEDLIISFITTFFLAFSYTQWIVCTTPKIYPLSGLFLVISFYLLLKVSAGAKKFIFALATSHALAMIAHNTNILFALPIIGGLLMGKQPLREKTKNILVYFSVFIITTAVIAAILIVINLHGISFNDILLNIKQQLAESSLRAKQAYTYMKGLTSARLQNMPIALRLLEYSECFLSFIVREHETQWPLILLICINFLFSMVFIRSFSRYARCVFLCLLWGITSFCIFVNTVYGNPNMYIPIFPFWIVMGIIFSVMARKTSIAPFKNVIRGLIITLFVLFLAILSYTNFKKEILPRHLGVTDPYFLPVKYYEKFLSPEDTVISDRLLFLYFGYFAKCQILGPELDMRKFPACKRIIDAQLDADKRVFFHKNSQFTHSSDYEKVQEKMSRVFNFIPYKSFSQDDCLFMLRRLDASVSGISGCSKKPATKLTHKPSVGPAIPASKDLAGDKLIVPGTRAGLYKLGDTISEVKKILGETTAINNNFSFGPLVSGIKYDYLEQIGLSFLADKGNKITLIFIHNRDFHTGEGIKIGSSFTDIEKHYGKAIKSLAAQSDTFFAEYPSGIAYLIRQKRVNLIFCKRSGLLK